MKKILITGGFGFLGLSLIDEIAEKSPGSKIYVIDNLSSSPILLDSLLEQVPREIDLTYDISDLRNSKLLLKSSPNFDEVYHLASYVGPVGILKHGGNIIRGIVDDGYQIIDYCLEKKARLLFVSSSEVYGGGVNGLCSEDTPKVIPSTTTIRLEYAVGKIAIETAIINISKIHGMGFSIIRPFNVAGPRQSGKGGFVLPRFVGAAIKGDPITVFGDGSAMRAFTHVRDVANGCYMAMNSQEESGVYNLGNPKNLTSIMEFAELVKGITGSKSPIVKVDPKAIFGDIYDGASNKFPDTTLLLNRIGWSPKKNLNDIISETWDFMKSLSANELDRIYGII